jgi:hypothetical protein
MKGEGTNYRSKEDLQEMRVKLFNWKEAPIQMSLCETVTKPSHMRWKGTALRSSLDIPTCLITTSENNKH